MLDKIFNLEPPEPLPKTDKFVHLVRHFYELYSKFFPMISEDKKAEMSLESAKLFATGEIDINNSSDELLKRKNSIFGGMRID